MEQRIQRFNLLELIICLGILAVLASILLDNFADVKSRECETLTMERGSHVRGIMKGRTGESGISEFLSDMGRFPSIYIPSSGDGKGGRRLAELYDPSIWYHSSGGSALQQKRTITASELREICQSPAGSTFPADDSGIYLSYPEINMNVGWNGPYINIPQPVKGNYYDGWGNSWKIISNYNLRVNNNRLEESSSVKIYATESEIDSLRDTGNNKRYRIDGILSYGANDSDDSSSSKVSAADMDQKFLFAHNMDNHGSENLSSLNIVLKLRDRQSGKWIRAPEISSWKASCSYHKGAIVIYDGSIYCCMIGHTSGTSFSTANWFKLSEASAYDPSTHGASGYIGMCIYEDVYYLRNREVSESGFTSSNWLRIAGVGEIPESLSLLIFTPVMQGSYDERIMQLGYYHFFRNPGNANPHGVKPVYGTAGIEDIDCEGDTTTVYGESDDYNSRYLTAEDHSGSGWSEFLIRRLIPGRRKVFCMIYNSGTGICYQSQVELVNLRPGNNYLTLYLEQKR